MYDNINEEEAVLRCLLSAMKILEMKEDRTDYHTILLRDLSMLAAELSHKINDGKPPKDNVVQFPSSKADEEIGEETKGD